MWRTRFQKLAPSLAGVAGGISGLHHLDRRRLSSYTYCHETSFEVRNASQDAKVIKCGLPSPNHVICYAYIHGFCSSPAAWKGTVLKGCFNKRGLELCLPDMNKPSFEKMTCTESLKSLDAMHAEAVTRANGAPVKWKIVGSSMGSYLAARWAELNPDKVDKLLLLSPAFDFPKIIECIMDPPGSKLRSKLADWKAKGSWKFGEADVHWGLVEDYLTHPLKPKVPCGTLILHGEQDTLVPKSVALDFAAAQPERVTVEIIEDDHFMGKTMGITVIRLAEFFDVPVEYMEEAIVTPAEGASQFDTGECKS